MTALTLRTTPQDRPLRRRRVAFRRPSVPGVVWAVALYTSSVTPSLIPRGWLMQAITSGICTAYGYGLGTGIGWLWRKIADRLELTISVSDRAGRWLRRAGIAILVTITLAAWLLNWGWQGQTAQLVGLRPPPPITHLLSLIVTVLLAAALVLAGRGLRALVRRWSATLRRFVPRWVAVTLAISVVAGTIWFVSDAVLYRGAMEYAASKAAGINATIPAGRAMPISPLRSGGPGSTQRWESLGHNGQAFVADGPTPAAIAAVTGRPALQPIRVYAGLAAGPSLEQVADAAVAELRRTGGFQRKVLAVMTTTGRGWVNEWSTSSIEYLAGGDSAIVAIQYSYLPSVVALLADRATPAAAGRLLFAKVHAEWARLPVDRRPRLVVGGESLGAYGGLAAFDGPGDMLSSIDGAVWVGTPNFTPLWRDLTEHRQGGSPEIAPVIDSGRQIRFATRPADLTQDVYGRTYGGWQSPRVVFVQHPSDPISWWSPSLLTDEPDWLRERVGSDVRDVRWASFATFWQLTTDLVVATSTPPGHGHRYVEELVPAWAAALGQDPSADYTAIATAIRRDYLPV